MIVYLIRHGQSANNLLAEQLSGRVGPFPFDRYMNERVHEPPLTEIGEIQAKLLSAYMAELGPASPPTRLYCSPMLRTLQTTQPLAEALNCAPSVWMDLHEQGGIFRRTGEEDEAIGFPGLSRAKVAELFPGYHADSIGEEGWWYGGEEDLASCFARAVRVAETLHQMAGKSDDERIGLVSHGTFMGSLLKALLGRLPGNGLYFNHHNTGVTRLDFARQQTNANLVMNVRYMNRADHLTADLMTH